MRLLQTFLLLTVFTLPLVTPREDLGYEETKVLFFLITISLTLGVWLVNHWREKVILTKIDRVGLFFILILGLTSLLGVDPKSSFFGRFPYFQGWILYAYFFLFYYLISRTKVKFTVWAIVLSSSALLVGGLALKDWLALYLFQQSVVTYAGRVVSTLGQPNFYAGFLLLSLPFSFFLTNKSGYLRYLGYLSLAGEIGGILVSGSRSAVLMLGLLTVYWLISKVAFKKILGSGVILVIIISILASLKLTSGLVWQELVEPRTNFWLIYNSPEKRTYVWEVVSLAINRRPLSGYGLENMAAGFYKHQSETSSIPARFVLKDLTVDRAHNYLLDLLFYSGVAGAVFWIYFSWLIFKKTTNPILMISLLIYFGWVQLQNQSIVHLVFYWWLAGLINNQT